ncbi:MAG: lipid-A-disaccharide synthase [Nitrospinales bacterium]
MSKKPIKLLMVAGEASGDLHGGNLAKALKSLIPDVEMEGTGGNSMREAGVSILYDINKMGAVGIVELVGSLFHHFKIYRKLSSSIAQQKYDAAILVNYPGLNLRLAERCKAAGCPVFFYISPQVWVWDRGRVKSISKTATKMYVILPFEEKIYKDAGVDVEYHGHPFVDIPLPEESREEFLLGLGLNPDKKTIGILPGSRMNEIGTLLKDMLDAANIIKRKIPDCQFVLPVADTIDPNHINETLGENPLDVKVVTKKTYNVMATSDFLIVASGSATLEAGILACPMVIIYQVHPLTLKIFSAFGSLEHFGLVNILADERVVPELLNQHASPEKIAEEALRVLEDPEYNTIVKEKLIAMRKTLGENGVTERIANSIVIKLKQIEHTADEKISI